MGRRSVEDIISDAETLADRFEEWEPSATGPVDGAPIKAVHDAFQHAAAAQSELADAIGVARTAGFSWAYIGSVMGTSGEAARKRYGRIDSSDSTSSPKRRLAG
jgi:hypothetical protein